MPAPTTTPRPWSRSLPAFSCVQATVSLGAAERAAPPPRPGVRSAERAYVTGDERRELLQRTVVRPAAVPARPGGHLPERIPFRPEPVSSAARGAWAPAGAALAPSRDVSAGAERVSHPLLGRAASPGRGGRVPALGRRALRLVG